MIRIRPHKRIEGRITEIWNNLPMSAKVEAFALYTFWYNSNIPKERAHSLDCGQDWCEEHGFERQDWDWMYIEEIKEEGES